MQKKLYNESVTSMDDVDVMNYTIKAQTERIHELESRIVQNENIINVLKELAHEKNWKELAGLLGVDFEQYTTTVIPELA